MIINKRAGPVLGFPVLFLRNKRTRKCFNWKKNDEHYSKNKRNIVGRGYNTTKLVQWRDKYALLPAATRGQPIRDVGSVAQRTWGGRVSGRGGGWGVSLEIEISFTETKTVDWVCTFWRLHCPTRIDCSKCFQICNFKKKTKNKKKRTENRRKWHPRQQKKKRNPQRSSQKKRKLQFEFTSYRASSFLIIDTRFFFL